MSCGHDDFFYLTRAAKIGRAARPQEPCDNTGPTRAFVGHWGKGGAGGSWGRAGAGERGELGRGAGRGGEVERGERGGGAG